MQVTDQRKEGRRLVTDGEERDFESTLSVEAVSTEVEIQNDECYVMSPVQ